MEQLPDLGKPEFDFDSLIGGDDEKEITGADLNDKTEQAKQQAQQNAAALGEVLAPVISVVFSVIAARRGEHWKLKAEESAALGESTAEVINHYYPEQSDLHPLVGFAVVAGITLAPRIAMDAENARFDSAKDVTGGQDGQAPERGTTE